MVIEHSKDKKFYDASAADLSVGELKHHSEVVGKYIATYSDKLDDLASKDGMSIVELGAGSCVTSLLLSRRTDINEIMCLDISLKKMKEVFPSSVKAVGFCAPSKITMTEGHFDARLSLDDHWYDVVIFDGALHHARSMWLVLEECKRILRPGGILIAQREQFLGTLSASIKLARLLQTPEVKAGVSENAYLKSQYEYYLRAVGFISVEFLAVAETKVQSVLRLLNGWIFSKWVIWARSPLS